jgi:hypothetical protein
VHLWVLTSANLAASRRRSASALPDAAKLSGRVSWQLKPPLSQQGTRGCALSHSALPVLKGEFDRLRPASLSVPLLNFSVRSCVFTPRPGVSFRWPPVRRIFSAQLFSLGQEISESSSRIWPRSNSSDCWSFRNFSRRRQLSAASWPYRSDLTTICSVGR